MARVATDCSPQDSHSVGVDETGELAFIVDRAPGVDRERLAARGIHPEDVDERYETVTGERVIGRRARFWGAGYESATGPEQ